jgi:hypothetical protein
MDSSQLIFHLDSGSELNSVAKSPLAPGLFAFPTLLKELIAAKPKPLISLVESNLATLTTAEG